MQNPSNRKTLYTVIIHHENPKHIIDYSSVPFEAAIESSFTVRTDCIDLLRLTRAVIFDERRSHWKDAFEPSRELLWLGF